MLLVVFSDGKTFIFKMIFQSLFSVFLSLVLQTIDVMKILSIIDSHDVFS